MTSQHYACFIWCLFKKKYGGNHLGVMICHYTLPSQSQSCPHDELSNTILLRYVICNFEPVY